MSDATGELGVERMTTSTGSESELRTRMLVALAAVPLCITAVWAGGVVFVLGMSALAMVGMAELVRMHGDRWGRPFFWPGVLAAGLLPLAAWRQGPVASWWLAAPYVLGLGAYGMATREPEQGPIAGAAVTTFGALYLGGLLGFAVPLRTALVDGRLQGTLLFFLPVVVTWLADSAAYFGGRSLGRRQLAPKVSPNKTVEGAVAEVLAAPLAALVYGLALLGPAGVELGVAELLVVGAAVAGAAILGDLVESALKRQCRVKDSSSLLPGHGGLLDRLDSLLWVFPMTYLLLTWV